MGSQTIGRSLYNTNHFKDCSSFHSILFYKSIHNIINNYDIPTVYEINTTLEGT